MVRDDEQPSATSAPEDAPEDPRRNESVPDSDARALIRAAAAARDEGDAFRSASTGGRTWRQELPRWLATLDSGRTRREYEKAVGYFFEAPGVPQELGALSFDLLLAYRGSLALRADRQARRQTRSAGAGGQPQVSPGAASDLLDGPSGDWEAANEPAGARGAALTSPLAPATVNVRLTALRQFLTHCSLWEHVPQLPPERMRAALRRLKVERRRPYQVLAELEWPAFLRAAAGASDAWAEPSAAAPSPSAQSASATPAGGPPFPRMLAARPGPWGTSRAARARQRGAEAPIAAAAAMPDAGHAVDQETDQEAYALPREREPERPRSRAGLTGRRTAQRDHALLALALASGLRAIELCSLDVGNLTREWHGGQPEWWLVLHDAQTKGQRGGRTLPLADSLVRTLLDYVESTGRSWERAADRTTPLFLSLRFGQLPGTMGAGAASLPLRRLAPEQVRRIVDRVETQWLAARGATLSERHAGEADTRAISPHALRHSTAVALLEGNERAGRAPASVEHVRGWLGHFDIRTTQGYLAHIDARRHRRPFALAPEPSAPTESAVDQAEADALPGDG